MTQAVNLCKSINYRSAGTVEFVADKELKNFYFLEVNTRLQVEHGITEMTDTDIVAWMMKGEIQNFNINQGTAIECRVCAEDPRQDFSPSFGIIYRLSS